MVGETHDLHQVNLTLLPYVCIIVEPNEIISKKISSEIKTPFKLLNLIHTGGKEQRTAKQTNDTEISSSWGYYMHLRFEAEKYYNQYSLTMKSYFLHNASLMMGLPSGSVDSYFLWARSRSKEGTIQKAAFPSPATVAVAIAIVAMVHGSLGPWPLLRTDCILQYSHV